MYRAASRESLAAAETAERRRLGEQRLWALLRALDNLLFELEELNVRGVTVAPDTVRRRAAALIAEASPLDAGAPVPEEVLELMVSVFDVQDVLLVQRQHGLGVAKTPAA